ncbi:uncharacterized protein LOC110023505 [Phalaenopsis equestris]|uniref:uncharacterized protein LOC110023505 n=1 Tax=Phalaenopsis equestris TaxID=78828 RepID=UPI0009E65559|nr:uncharacterized protein LOC110023505 [Phalaenopsis equestris]
MEATNNKLSRSFLKTMLMGLKLGGVSSRKMNIKERKRTIKLSANIAMVSTAVSRGMNWSRALIARQAKHKKNRIFMRRILGRKRYESITRPYFALKFQRMMRKRKHIMNSTIRRKVRESSNEQENLVNKRTRILKRVVPGAEYLDDLSLWSETIDYVISLQAQVSLMRLLAETLGV